MHWIQRHILKQLAFNDSLRYRELIPNDVEGNLFQYYAKQLEHSGLLNRSSGGYRLTDAGQNFVADLSQTKLMRRQRLARAVVMIALTDETGNYGLFKWRRHPYRGLVSLPFGRQIAGHSSSDMAAIQLLLKSGYNAELRLVGLVDIIDARKAQIDHLSCQVFIATNPTHSGSPDGLTGEFFWGRPAQVATSDAVAGFHRVITWLENPSRPTLLEINLASDQD